MKERDLGLLALRPDIDTQPASGVAAFLHETLRPVLKLQNDTLLTLVAADVSKRVRGFEGFAPADQQRKLLELLRRDSRLKRVVLGVVFGMLTAEELAFALAHESEVRRRIVTLVAERVASQTEEVARRVGAEAGAV